MTGGPKGRDLRDLPAPEPLELVLAEIERLPRGGHLHVILRHEPAPLFTLLPDRGMAWRCVTRAPGEVHVLLWRAADAAAREVAERWRA